VEAPHAPGVRLGGPQPEPEHGALAPPTPSYASAKPFFSILLGGAVTIQDLGSLGELIAAIATVATLGYLALQIRQNTHATRASSFHAVSDARNQVNLAVVQDPDLARIWLEGGANRSALSAEDRLRFDVALVSYFHVIETMHYQASVGAGEKGLLVAEERSLRDLLSTPGIREWWHENPWAFGLEFRAYIETFLDEPRGASDRGKTAT
jgi:hypothetical protein